MADLRIISVLLGTSLLGSCSAVPKLAATVSTPAVSWTPFTQAAPATTGTLSATQTPQAWSTHVPKRFSIFFGALEETGVASRLLASDGYTIFAPPNEVINQMPAATRAAVFQNRAKLTEVLEYHIVEGTWTQDILPSVTMLPTLLGKPLTVAQGESQTFSVNGVSIHPTKAKIHNLTIYSIDALLIPPG